MKNYVAKIMTAVTVFAACGLSVSCDPPEAIVSWPNKWYLENVSESKFFYRFDDEYMQALSPGEITLINFKPLPYTGEEKDFNALFEREGYTTFKIYLEMNGEPVKVWSREEANSPGKQFWKEESWTAEIPTVPANSQSATWIFKVTQEDLE